MKFESMTSVDDAAIRAAVSDSTFLWIDLESPSTDDLHQLQAIFDLHPLAIEDASCFDQRPKLEEYENHDFMVYYSAEQTGSDSARPIEVHLFIHGSALITVRRDDVAGLVEIRERLHEREALSETFIIYEVLDALTDTFFPILAMFDDVIDELEDEIIESLDPDQLHRIFHAKRHVVRLRRIAASQRDTMMRAAERILVIPNITADSRVYLRDVLDHTIRVNDSLDAQRDLLVGLVELYQSAVANRQNTQMQQLTLVATVFLPLMFLTGFFGQNFAWMVNHMDSRLSFLVLGVGGSAVSAIGISTWLRLRRYW